MAGPIALSSFSDCCEKVLGGTLNKRSRSRSSQANASLNIARIVCGWVRRAQSTFEGTILFLKALVDLLLSGSCLRLGLRSLRIVRSSLRCGEHLGAHVVNPRHGPGIRGAVMERW